MAGPEGGLGAGSATDCGFGSESGAESAAGSEGACVSETESETVTESDSGTECGAGAGSVTAASTPGPIGSHTAVTRAIGNVISSQWSV